MKNQQLEIGLKSTRCHPKRFRQQRLARARWWFDQMRRVVSEAPEWPSTAGGQGSQATLPFGSR